MSYREVRKLISLINAEMGRIPRRDRLYEDQAAKQRAYRLRKKLRQGATPLFDAAIAEMLRRHTKAK